MWVETFKCAEGLRGPGASSDASLDGRTGGGSTAGFYHRSIAPLIDPSSTDRRALWFRPMLPLAVAAVGLFAALPFIDRGDWLAWFVLSFVYLVPPAGKESVVPSGVALGIHPIVMAYLVTVVDVACALFISLNFPLAKRVPFLGRYITFIESKGGRALEGSPVLRAGLWAALVLFVIVPFQGSGGITAAIIGRAVGMRLSHLVTAIGTGAAIGGLLIGYSASVVKVLLARDLLSGIMYMLLAVTALLCAVVVFRFVRMRSWERA
jgi:hypothetical protein